MKKYVETNLLMREILLSEDELFFSRTKKRRIEREIISFFDKVHLYEAKTDKCFSTENFFESNPTLFCSPDILNEFEWNKNEIFLEKGIIGKDFKNSIYFALQTIERLLAKHFSGNSFYICVSAQYGNLRNINIRIYLKRNVPYVNFDEIEDYAQPVLNETLEV